VLWNQTPEISTDSGLWCVGEEKAGGVEAGTKYNGRRNEVNRKAIALLLAIPALGLGVAACSDDSDSDSNGDMGGVTQTATDAGNIVDVAADTPDLSTLVEAVTAADLAETLQGEGPFTVFAPTNEAFDALPAGELDRLLEPANQEELANILKYHVVEGEVMSSDLTNGQKAKTLEGGTLTVTINGGTVKINDATVATADVPASNGVVHVIDRVLLP
jgi:uncharacterized surface protein with fasciclin (FAS1) repeats